jgi:hypothetical protein
VARRTGSLLELGLQLQQARRDQFIRHQGVEKPAVEGSSDCSVQATGGLYHLGMPAKSDSSLTALAIGYGWARHWDWNIFRDDARSDPWPRMPASSAGDESQRATPAPCTPMRANAHRLDICSEADRKVLARPGLMPPGAPVWLNRALVVRSIWEASWLPPDPRVPVAQST